MIQLPDFSKAFEYENNFYLSSDITRTSKFLAHYELYKMVHHLPGAMIECGVFKGASFVRWATFRELTANPFGQKLIGFDIFGKFPETNFEEDKTYREKFVQSAGEESIDTEQLMEVLRHKRLDRNVELVAGDVCQTVPKYVHDNPHLKISLINLDTDVYEPAVTILEHLYPRLVRGGVLILDDYGTFPGETKAVDDFFKGKNVTIRKFPFAMTPCFVVKED